MIQHKLLLNRTYILYMIKTFNTLHQTTGVNLENM